MSELTEYERGFAEAIEKAAKEVASIAAIFDSPSIYMGGPTRRAKNLAEEVAAAIRALSPSTDTVRVPVSDFRRMWEALETDETIKWCETCGAWLTDEEAASTEDYTGCWKIATGGKHNAENCKSYRADWKPRAMIAEVK